MDKITIQLEEVSEKSKQIHMCNEACNTHLNEISSIMKRLSASWQSPASEMIQMRYFALSPVFENYRTIIDQYAAFLSQTVQTYQTLEDTIHASAESFNV